MSDINNDSDHTVPEIDRLIHEPARYNIMALLYVVEGAEFLFVKHQTHLTPGNLSSHLSKLENAGYVEIKKEFIGKVPRTLLALTARGRTVFENYRNNMRTILDNLP